MVNIELWNEKRKELKISLAKLSEITDISISTLKDIFRGATTDPRIETVQRIERALGINAQNEKTPPQLSDGEQKLIELFRLVPQDQQDLVLSMINGAIESLNNN